MYIQAVTLFGEMFRSITDYGVTGRALQRGLWHFNSINPRQFADNKLGYIDDRPFGGGPGMIMMAEPLQSAMMLPKRSTTVKWFTSVRKAARSHIKKQPNWLN